MPTRTRTKIASAVVFCVLVTSIVALTLRFVHVSLNLSESMPLGLYRTWAIDRAPRRGDIVTVCAPPAAATTGARRGYLPRGSCDAATAPLIKYVAAAAGDTVVVSKSGIAIDGTPLLESRALVRDGLHRPMHAYPAGRTVLRTGQVWLYAPRPRSFDSRYFGPVPVSRIRSYAAPIAVF